MAKRINFWELPVEDAQPDDTVPAYRGRGQVARVRLPDGGGGEGTVTSVGVSMPTGFAVANSPVTSSGTITVTFASGYGLPTTAKQGQWDAAYSWGDHAQAGYALASAVTSALAGKVDKVSGKGLSTEDYTTAEKSKLAGIEAGATANQTDAYLLNRANHTGTQAASTISGLATVATTGSYNDLTDKPTIPAAQVPADWNATSGVARILNKPSLGTAASANAGDFATAAQGAKADTAFGWGNHASAGYAPLTSPQFSGTPAAQRIVLESAAPSNPNDSNSWADGVSMVQHASQGWAPENYIGVLHAGINVNRAFQLTVGANGFYVRRIHSSATNAQWQTVWTDKNFNPSNYVTTAAMQAYTYSKSEIEDLIDGGGMTAAQIKTLYESNANTNAFTDAEKSKLAAAGTNANGNKTISTNSPSGGANGDVWYQVDS